MGGGGIKRGFGGESYEKLICPPYLDDYFLKTSGSGCKPVTSISECNAAARALGLSDTTASPIPDRYPTYPPYCYYIPSLSSLYYNVATTGQCTSIRNCVCSKGKHIFQIYSTSLFPHLKAIPRSPQSKKESH